MKTTDFFMDMSGTFYRKDRVVSYWIDDDGEAGFIVGLGGENVKDYCNNEKELTSQLFDE